MGYGAIQIISGVTNLSELGIDVAKNWGLFQIKNVGNPSEAKDVVNQETALIWLASMFSTTKAILPVANTIYRNITAYPQLIIVNIDLSLINNSEGPIYGAGLAKIQISADGVNFVDGPVIGFSRQYYEPLPDPEYIEHIYAAPAAIIPPGYYWQVYTEKTAPGSADINTQGRVWGAAESGYPP